MEAINELAIAFAKAQGEYSPVGVNRENSFFKSSYADLDAIIAATRPALSKNGLSFLQFTTMDEAGRTVLVTRLLHASGQYIDGRIALAPEKNDVQSFGKCLTYHKRYAAMSLLGVCASQDPQDDDGSQPAQQQYVETRVAQWQLQNINNALTGRPDIHKDLLKSYNIESVEEVEARNYNKVMEAIARRKLTPKPVNVS